MKNPANPPASYGHAPRLPMHSNPIIESYAALLKSVRAAGLMRRRRTFYALVFAAAGTGFLLLGQTWFQLLIAAALGILFTQFA